MQSVKKEFWHEVWSPNGDTALETGFLYYDANWVGGEMPVRARGYCRQQANPPSSTDHSNKAGLGPAVMPSIYQKTRHFRSWEELQTKLAAEGFRRISV